MRQGFKMKKIFCLIFTIIFLLNFSSCQQKTSVKQRKTTTDTEKSIDIKKDDPKTPEHTHTFSDATCTQPQRCVCGKTRGKALGHIWKNATCTTPQKCTVCSITKGKAKHKYANGVCKHCYKTKIGLKLDCPYYIVRNDSSGDSIIVEYIFHKYRTFSLGGAYGTAWENYPGCQSISYKGKTYYQGDVGGPSRDFVIKGTEIIIYDVDSLTEIELKLTVNKQGNLITTYSKYTDTFAVGEVWLRNLK